MTTNKRPRKAMQGDVEMVQVATYLPRPLMDRLDSYCRANYLPNRTEAFRRAVVELLDRWEDSRNGRRMEGGTSS